MLISFTVRNFLSIRDLQTLNLEARTDDHLEWSNVIQNGKHRLVKSVALFGPNASGKSNLLDALLWFRFLVVTSSRDSQAKDLIPVHPFAFSTETEASPSYAEIEFIQNEMVYRYGFQVTAEKVISEWLYRKRSSAREAKLFTRSEQEIHVSGWLKEAKGLEKHTRENSLFLSVCSQLNVPEAKSIMEWMQQLRYISGLAEQRYFRFTAKEFQRESKNTLLADIARIADPTIVSIRSEIEEPDMETRLQKADLLAAKSPRAEIKVTRQKYDANGEAAGSVEFDLKEDESQGTRKFIALCGPIVQTLEEGLVLIVDEMEARLHPKLTQAIVDLFHSSTNTKNAQLIFATHDVTLLDPDRFRRDQIWFCEKDAKGGTDVFQLAEFDSDLVRPTSKFGKQYMLGIFGAVPELLHLEEAVSNAKK
ncbi:ATP-binding protein [Verrucomicrobia bacterium LW23]|nr:ATP-binding protein [Verrucomicrobia bacterium LW23]